MQSRSGEGAPKLKKLNFMQKLETKMAAGSVAGLIGVSLTYPLDFAKTQLQLYAHLSPPKYINMRDVLVKVRAEKGYLGWYAGLKPNLLGIIFEKALKLAINDLLRGYCKDDKGRVGIGGEVLAGAGAGFGQVVVTTPMEVLKIQCAKTQESMADVFRRIGIRGCYRGFGITMTRDVFFSIIFFPLNFQLKGMMADPEDTQTGKTLKALAAGCGAGMVGAAASTPIDVVKTQMQSDPSDPRPLKMRLAVSQVWSKGIMWRGLVPRIAAITPLMGVAVMVYDLQNKLLIHYGLNPN